jgi:hypothetical protein
LHRCRVPPPFHHDAEKEKPDGIIAHQAIVVGLAATALTAGTSKFAFAQQPTGDVIGELVNNEGIFVDGKTFKIARGKAKGDPAAQIAKLGAKEVGPGAIVFRYNDKLYLVEAPAPLPQQAMKDFQDNWNVSYMKAMKDFQDNWNISYMTNVQSNSTFPTTKDFQDNWNVSYIKAMKDFQDNWNVSYLKAMKDFQDNWNVSYMKNFQDNWNVSYMRTVKDFQDN